jgi:uncharacterized protein YbdZ (MbtH family)
LSNPFEDENRQYVVLVNQESAHSLWPAEIAVPAGWTVVHGASDRTDCLSYVTTHWSDMRPASLVGRMDQAGGLTEASRG